MDDSQVVSAQLNSELRASLRKELDPPRPILHHLNADSSWLLQLPRPTRTTKCNRQCSGNADSPRRMYYNVLIDPWLAGGQSDLASWFSQQFHATPSAFGSIAAVETLARETENHARGEPDVERDEGAHANGHEDKETTSYIDAVAISHEFTDHCHKDTLLQVNPNIPVFAIKAAASLIKGWKHFRTVTVIPSFGSKSGETCDWRKSSIPPLPDWLGISRLVQTDDVVNLHAALIIAFNLSGQSISNGRPISDRETDSHKKTEAAEAIIYSPHGVHASDFAPFQRADPHIRTLALLHGLHAVKVGTKSRTALQTNHGAHNGLAVQRAVKARYWIGTHDEVKTSGGFVSWFLQRKVLSIKDALDAEQAARNHGDSAADDNGLHEFDDVNWLELANGESKVLR